MSVATEFVDTDWDEEETILTDVEDNSPRVSVQSVCPNLSYAEDTASLLLTGGSPGKQHSIHLGKRP